MRSRRHSAGTHYEFLGLPPDAELKEVQSRARALRVQLEGLRGRKLSPRHAALVAPLLARVAFAADVIGVASERLAYDARSGNHLGVARCIAAGLPEALLAQRRLEFLRERPGSEARVRQCLTRAKVARAVGNLGLRPGPVRGGARRRPARPRHPPRVLGAAARDGRKGTP